MQLLPAALRALSAALQADCKGRRQQQGGTQVLCLKLLAHPRADVFLDVVFDATRTLYRMVSACFPCAMSRDCSGSWLTLRYLLTRHLMAQPGHHH